MAESNAPRRTRQSGFSLMELIVVIAVIALLAGVIAPMFTSVTQSGKVAAFLKFQEGLRSACGKFRVDTSTYAHEYNGYPAANRQLSASSSTVAGWKGPYIEGPFTNGTNMFSPSSGCHLYATSNPNSWNASGWDLDGDDTADITGNVGANVLYLPGISEAEAKEIDATIDKGVGGSSADWTSTGRVEYIAASSIMLVLVQR